MSTNTTTLAFQLLAAANYIDALGGDSASYRQTLAAHEESLRDNAEQAALRDLECPPDPEMVDRALAADDQKRAYARAAVSAANSLAQRPNLADRAVQKRLAAQWGYGVAQRQPLTEWQPIETAPKDGTRLILSDGKFVGAGVWVGRYFAWGVSPEPTHWMPLPAAPGTTTGEQR